jgi:hypothetical protein
MELSSPEVIRALTTAKRRPNHLAHRGGVPASCQPSYGDRRRHCQCGRCRGCLDNARWERIFAEKFADPNYYTR